MPTDSTSSRAKGGPGTEPSAGPCGPVADKNCALGATQSFQVRGLLSRNTTSRHRPPFALGFPQIVFPGSSGDRQQDMPAGPGAPHAPARGLPPVAPSPPPGRAQAHTPPQQPVQVTQCSRGGIPPPPLTSAWSPPTLGDCLPICQGAPQCPGWSCSPLLMLLTQIPSSPQRTSA